MVERRFLAACRAAVHGLGAAVLGLGQLPGAALAQDKDPAVICDMSCVAASAGGCAAGTARQIEMGHLIVTDNPVPQDWQQSYFKLAAGRALHATGAESTADTLKSQTVLFYEDGTAGVVETELFHDGDVQFAVYRGTCKETTEY